jgi:hypothetical protein
VAHIPQSTLLKEMDYVGSFDNLIRTQICGNVVTLSGFFLYTDTGGLVMLLAGLYQGSNTEKWHSAEVISLIVIGAVLFISCFIWDFNGFAKRPLFPLYMFKKLREFTFLITQVSFLKDLFLISNLLKVHFRYWILLLCHDESYPSTT